MIVLKWMTKEVITAGPDTPIHQIYNIFQKNDIHRVPVMSGEKLVGIISDRDVRTALPLFSDKVLPENISEALKRKKASDVMTREVITIGPLDTIEKAALLMLNHKFGALPVLNNGQLSGIITEHDIFEALLEVTGAKWGVPRLSMVIDDRPGSVKEVADIIRNYPAKILSFLITKYQMPPDKRELILRVDSDQLPQIITDLEKKYGKVIVHESS